MSKKILILFFVICMFIAPVFAIEPEFNQETKQGITGIRLYKDYAWNWQIIYIEPHSIAEQMDVPLGWTLLKVDGVKIRSLSLAEIMQLLNGEAGTKVELTLKTPYLYRTKKIVLVRERSHYNPFNNSTFNIHWLQVAPSEYAFTPYMQNFWYYSTQLQNYINAANYWANRRQRFKKGFDLCNTYSESNKEGCYMHLVTRELNKTMADEQARRDALILQEQTLMMNTINNQTNVIKNQTDAINRANNSLQYQNMQLQNLNRTLRDW